MLPTGEWVFIGLALNSATTKQSGFRYRLSSASIQTIVYASRGSSGGTFYDLQPTASVLVGGDSFYYPSCGCQLRYARVYVDYFPDSADEYINLCIMDTGKIKLKLKLTKEIFEKDRYMCFILARFRK